MMLFVTVSSWAQDPIDIKGWNNTSWGMTEENIIQLFGGKITKFAKQEVDDGKFYRKISLDNFNIDGVNFNAVFEMGSVDNRLRRVRLICDPAISLHFSKFEQLLTSKYGQPKSKDETRTDKSASWMLPSTKIDLDYSHLSIGGYIMNIIYTDQSTVKESSDKL